MPLVPNPAATVVLLREGETSPEILLIQRHPELVFGGGAFVFPGGRVDAADHVPLPGCDVDHAMINRLLGVADGGLAYLQAALRECFEEAGILLAEYPDGTPLSAARLTRLRNTLRASEADLPAILTRTGLVPTIQGLRYFGRWITPPGFPRRFDTRFFVTTAPAQDVVICGEETVDACWMTPEQALEKGEQGLIWLMEPTRRTLTALTGHRTIDDLYRYLDEREMTTDMIRPANG